MKNTKNQKGITLVALVVTIVIMLILSVVAIASIENNDLITYVDDAVEKHDAKKEEEDGILGGYTELIDKYLGGDTIGNTIENTIACTHEYFVISELVLVDGEYHQTISACQDCSYEEYGQLVEHWLYVHNDEIVYCDSNCGIYYKITTEEVKCSHDATKHFVSDRYCVEGCIECEVGWIAGCVDENGDSHCDKCGREL